MRDPSRIPYMMSRLQLYWENNPDMRLGQIIGNAAASASRSMQPDAYYIEDEDLIANLWPKPHDD